MLSAEERAVVETVADWVDGEVRPVVRDMEHANTYPERLIEQMKEMGIYGLAIPGPWVRPRCRCRATRWSPRSCPAAG